MRCIVPLISLLVLLPQLPLAIFFFSLSPFLLLLFVIASDRLHIFIIGFLLTFAEVVVFAKNFRTGVLSVGIARLSGWST